MSMRIRTTVEWCGDTHVACGETNDEIIRLENLGHKIIDVSATKLLDNKVMYIIKYELNPYTNIR